MEPAHATRPLRFLLLGAALLALAVGCDTDISGTALENQAPETHLSVRDSSLVDNLAGSDRLSSTVFVSWSGTDTDGYVASFEVRFYPLDDPPADPEGGWAATVRNDSLVLLPIPRGQRNADVVFEVRAIDNENAKDPTPARTVFPIQNAPPTIRFSQFELPPDTTFHVISFSWVADDPEGADNLARLEISLNDSTSLRAIPPDVAFITLIGEIDRNDPAQTVTEATVFFGRSFQRSTLTLSGLRLNADNTFFLRAVDLTDTTSTLQRFSWFVKRPSAEVLYVNDYRNATALTIQRFHLDLLRQYLPVGTPIDTWDISHPFATGTAGSAPRSNALPVNPDPTLRQQLAFYSYIYWVSTNATNSITSNNLPFAASVLDLFFENGGKMMVHTPISLPPNPEDNLGNSAILLLPLNDLIVFPDTLRPQLRLPIGSAVNPVGSVPGVATPLPALEIAQFRIDTLPYVAQSNNTLPLYEAAYRFVSLNGQNQGIWPGPSTIASISADRRVALFALPLLNEQSSAPVLIGTDGNPDAGIRAVHLILESLGFPKR